MAVELLDLSVPITTGMPVCPGDPEVEAAPALTVAEAVRRPVDAVRPG